MSTSSSKRRGAVTQKDVAKRAGVSQAAVSAVFRGDTRKIGVSAATRERILQAVKELDYRPNTSARAMRSQRTFNLGFFSLAKGYLHHEPIEYRDGLYTAATERNYHIVLVRLNPSADGEPEMLPAVFRQAHLDALVIGNARYIPPEIGEAVSKSNLPVVYLNEKRTHNAVYCDDVLGTRLLMERLFARGLRRIDYIRLHRRDDHHSSTERQSTYQTMMQEQGLTPTVHLLPEKNPESKLIERMREPERPEALVVYNEHTLLQMERTLIAAGVFDPTIQYATFDLGLAAQYIAHPYLCVAVPRLEMGRAAANMAIDLSDRERGSTAPAICLKPHLEEVAGLRI
ncbi:MAG: LacI family DNA-binding transcriptional regulator [Opitutales bacterium]